MEKGLADLELRSDIDPYMNDLARLGWDIATRGENQDDPKRQGLAATIANKLRHIGRFGGRTYFPDDPENRREDKIKLEKEYERQAGRPVKKDMSILYLAGEGKDHPRGEDYTFLVHELGHLASVYLAKQGLLDKDSPINPAVRYHESKRRGYTSASDPHEDLIRKITKQTREKLTKEPSVIESLLDMLSIKDFQESRVDVPINRDAPTSGDSRREWNADRRISDDVVEEAYNLARSSLRERGLPPEVKYKGLASLGEK
jgi:hypothetical protein